MGLHETFEKASGRQVVSEFTESIARHEIEFNGVSNYYGENTSATVQLSEDGSPEAWQAISTQFTHSIAPTLQTLKYAKSFLLGIRLNQIVMERKYHMNWHVSAPTAYNGDHRTIGGHSYAYSMTLKSKEHQSLQVVQGNQADSRIVFIPGDAASMATKVNLNPNWTVNLVDATVSLLM